MNWIKTSDEKPKRYTAVLAHYDGQCYVAYINDRGTWRMDEDNDEATTPTHWMPLPEQPK